MVTLLEKKCSLTMVSGCQVHLTTVLFASTNSRNICEILIFVSATPGNFELQNSLQIVEQLVRPTGLIDPKVTIRPTRDQMQQLIREISIRAQRNQRTLVTTLTKRMAEDLAEDLAKHQIRVRYLHSEIEGLERTELIRQLRVGEFDVLVGINLLREGLDIPEVSLVAILDADKEGFLRNSTSLIQTFGRQHATLTGSSFCLETM